MIAPVPGNLYPPPQEINRKGIVFLVVWPGKAQSLNYVILSQTKNIDKVLFMFLFGGDFVHLLVLFKFPKAKQLIYGNLAQIMWLGPDCIS